MISLVLYGRNDNYGYNLHKRAALSLNCMAEVLTGQDDEILFVDYNTPDDFPTFPEAIQDTLTAQAKKKLRILRVRPDVHRRLFAHKTHLIALEPVSRNVAVRRSNPNNRWILSSNTDMIFVPSKGRSLTESVGGLPDGFYCAPRLEIPETLWEDQFDRMNPERVIELTRDWGWRYHLNEVVYGADTILYDGPGDFQLMLREDLFRYHGFHEEMLRGWHVDSNISKRLCLVHGAVGDAAPYVYGYHCDHTRQITAMHKSGAVENSTKTFIDDVAKPDIPEQADTWGLADEEIEEVRLIGKTQVGYASALDKVIEPRLKTPILSYYKQGFFDKNPAHPGHILPFLLDLFVNARSGQRILWLGPRGEMFDLFSKALDVLDNGHIIETCEHDSPRVADLIERADTFVVNFGVPHILPNHEIMHLWERLKAIQDAEQLRHDEGRPRRVVGLNAVHTSAEPVMTSIVDCAKTPFSCRLRHGYVKARKHMPKVIDAREKMLVTEHGRILPDGRVATNPQLKNRHLRDAIYGPYLNLEFGSFRLEADLSCDETQTEAEQQASEGRHARVVLKIGQRTIYARALSAQELRKCHIAIDFAVTTQTGLGAMEFVVSSNLTSSVALDSISVTRILEEQPQQKQFEPLDCLPVLNFTSRIDGFSNKGLVVKAGGEIGWQRNCLFGPYVTLPQGSYRLEVEARLNTEQRTGRLLKRLGMSKTKLSATVRDSKKNVASSRATVSEDGMHLCVPFEVTDREFGELFEFVLDVAGPSSLVVTSMKVKKADV
ncbi:hypothetical protein [Rhizobium sp. L1K21]|uniref:hypothetical protein n=1 Tax=Rhizobium sp. L1K21 TaxID=2954933 RepID=UPI002092A744|nr:hypothetical protein [Rhizobium sp. L1K21]MCO6187967.1 hypothetical protein [Rhizobium sp. L1K21]